MKFKKLKFLLKEYAGEATLFGLFAASILTIAISFIKYVVTHALVIFIPSFVVMFIFFILEESGKFK